MLELGRLAPDFRLPDQEGAVHALTDYQGQWVLLYFYPKDNTPGCTVEACSLRDHWVEFAGLNAVVLGVSVDSVASHQKFAKGYDLPFPILADPDKQIVQAYEVWAPKKMMGRAYVGTYRRSFLIDPTGRLAKIYLTVKPSEHAKQVLVDLKALQQK